MSRALAIPISSHFAPECMVRCRILGFGMFVTSAASVGHIFESCVAPSAVRSALEPSQNRYGYAVGGYIHQVSSHESLEDRRSCALELREMWK